MTSRRMTYDDCCLLSHIPFNAERISHLLECRFKSNSIRTSFDFKSIPPEKPSNKAKISRSLLRFSLNQIKSQNTYDEHNSSESSDDEMNDEVLSPKSPVNQNDDDYLNRLAEWEPNTRQPMIESDDEQEEEPQITNDIQSIQDNNSHADSMDSRKEMSTSQVEDLLITFVNRPIKKEPMINDYTELYLSQLDGQTDFLFETQHKKQKRKNQNKKTHPMMSKTSSQSSRKTKTMEFRNISETVNTLATYSKTKLPKQSKNHHKTITQSQHIDENLHHQNKNKQRISSSSNQGKSIGKRMSLIQTTLDNCRKLNADDSDTDFIENTIHPISIPKNSKLTTSTIEKNLKQRKRLDTKFTHKSRTKIRSLSKRKTKLSMEHNGKTILDYFKVERRSTKNDNIQYFPVVTETIDRKKSTIKKIREKPATTVHEYIVIDDHDDNIGEDNDIELVEDDSSSIFYNIKSREKLLDHIVDSSAMRVKWLVNLELVLREHISIYNQETNQIKHEASSSDCAEFRSSNNILSYRIKASFISVIIKNFLKIFIIRNLNNDKDEIAFFQYGLTSHLRYLLVELPTYDHENNHNNENTCSQCSEYFSLINVLFDLLFDLIEYDLCEIYNKKTYRSILIEDDYFNRFIQRKNLKTNNFDRIKLIIYLIELIEIHRNKCQNKKETFHINENQIFHSMENFLRHIILKLNNLNTERLSICFNVMELCLMFVKEKEIRIQRIATFLAQLCEENPTYLHIFLFDETLLPDIRLFLINKLISKKFTIKFISSKNIMKFFDHIKSDLKVRNSLDDVALLLTRSLFSTWADLMISIQDCNIINEFVNEHITLLRNQLKSMCTVLKDISHDSRYTKQIERTVILFRLLQYKWKHF